MHRAGRTARAGAAGKVTNLVGKKDETLAHQIHKQVRYTFVTPLPRSGAGHVTHSSRLLPQSGAGRVTLSSRLCRGRAPG
eukprot:2604487-Pyramimonas_sp.AAC.1